jgi:hypothetical protein
MSDDDEVNGDKTSGVTRFEPGKRVRYFFPLPSPSICSRAFTNSTSFIGEDLEAGSRAVVWFRARS